MAQVTRRQALSILLSRGLLPLAALLPLGAQLAIPVRAWAGEGGEGGEAKPKKAPEDAETKLLNSLDWHFKRPLAPEYIRLPEFVVNLSAHHRGRFLRAIILLEVPREADRVRVKAIEPLIVNAYNTYLRACDERQLMTPPGIDKAKTELQALANKAIGSDAVDDVLFPTLLIRE